MAPVICCRSFGDKNTLLALGWSITSLLSFLAFISATVMTVLIYRHAEQIANANAYSSYNNGEHDNNHQNNENKDVSSFYSAIATLDSRAVAFAGIYVTLLTVGLSVFGAIKVIGFMNFHGSYVPPMEFDDPLDKEKKKHVGIFLGALILFSNLLLVCSIVLNEFKVMDGVNEQQKLALGVHYAVENVSRLLSITFIALSILYFMYGCMVFLWKDVLISSRTKSAETQVHEPVTGVLYFGASLV